MPSLRLSSLSFVVLLALSACAEFPELDGTVPADVARRDFPALVPLDAALGAPAATASRLAVDAQSLAARAAALRARAARLRRSDVIDRTTQARFDAATD